MDYGDDAMLSAKYASVHATADACLQPAAMGRLEMLRNRSRWRNYTLDDMRDKGITPEMLSASGATWPSLHAKHGTDALVQFGYTWPLMVQSGFTARHLRQLTSGQMSHLGINAVRAMECRPGVADVCALQLPAPELADMGWTRDMLVAIGLNMRSMVGFGYPLSAWKTYFGVDNYGAMGFDDYATCAAAGWCDGDIREALRHKVPAPLPAPRAAQGPKKKLGEIRFI